MRELRTNFDQKVVNRYDTEKDLYDRLSGTICRYDGQPYYVRIDAPFIYLIDMTNPQGTFEHRISYDDPLFDISSIELGYANIVSNGENEAVYIKRSPNRQYHQGLEGSYLLVTDIEGKPHPEFSGSCIFHSQGFKESLSGEFPSLDMAFELLSSEKHDEVAISQDIALVRTEVGVIVVCYRTVQVGWAPPDSKTITLTNNDLRWVVERHMGRFNWIIK